jgi:hypothetical protein
MNPTARAFLVRGTEHSGQASIPPARETLYGANPCSSLFPVPCLLSPPRSVGSRHKSPNQVTHG